jgi:hypothetical protein
MDVASQIFSLWAESGYVDQRLLVTPLQAVEPARSALARVSSIKAPVRDAK